jgi:hypothetical protein
LLEAYKIASYQQENGTPMTDDYSGRIVAEGGLSRRNLPWDCIPKNSTIAENFHKCLGVGQQVNINTSANSYTQLQHVFPFSDSQMRDSLYATAKEVFGVSDNSADPLRLINFTSSNWIHQVKAIPQHASYYEDTVLLVIVEETSGAIHTFWVTSPTKRVIMNTKLKATEFIAKDRIVLNVNVDCLEYWYLANHQMSIQYSSLPDQALKYRVNLKSSSGCRPDWTSSRQDRNISFTVHKCHCYEVTKQLNPIVATQGTSNPLEYATYLSDIDSMTMNTLVSINDSLTATHPQGIDAKPLSAVLEEITAAHVKDDEKHLCYLYCKYLEAKFMEHVAIDQHFRDISELDVSIDAFERRLLQMQDEAKEFSDEATVQDMLVERIRTSYAVLAEQSSAKAQQAKTANIVTFNVQNESVCLLKSSIAKVIPNSQLAIRVLGDWTEGPTTLDEPGRFIIVSSFHYELCYALDVC